MSATKKTIASVLLPQVFGGPFDYFAGDATVGCIVMVPFGSQLKPGVVVALKSESDVDPAKLKNISHVYPPRLTPASIQFLRTVATYTLTPPGLVLKMALSVPNALKSWEADALLQESPSLAFKEPTYGAQQASAAHALKTAVSKEEFQPILLEGITGSGKTEVYFKAVAEALTRGQQVLIMLPEIALSEQWIDRFQKRFGAPPTLFHSSLTPRQRRLNWHAVAANHAKVVVGTRSSLFLPFQSLGLIVVDEEHDTSYKQDTNVLYQGRDMAVQNAKVWNCPVILSSATPSLETLYNVSKGRYERLLLDVRHGDAKLPTVHVVDMRGAKTEGDRILSNPLRDALTHNLAQGQQSLLFLNRRGYAPIVLCTTCGGRASCSHCSTSLIYHKSHNVLRCHHCGLIRPHTTTCPDCLEPSLVTAGVGIERALEHVERLFPMARTAVITSDSTDPPLDTIRRMHQGEIDILIGTQLIAKGHHFPNLTVVGVLDADMGLNAMDIRAGEKTYQLLEQVAGRAGRELLPGHIYLQTLMPENPMIQALASFDKDHFLENEGVLRERSHMPPYARLASLIISSKSMEQAEEWAKKIGAAAPSYKDLTILGPAPALIQKRQNWHRWRFLLQVPRGDGPSINLQKCIQDWLQAIKPPPAVRVTIDIDPYSFY